MRGREIYAATPPSLNVVELGYALLTKSGDSFAGFGGTERLDGSCEGLFLIKSAPGNAVYRFFHFLNGVGRQRGYSRCKRIGVCHQPVFRNQLIQKPHLHEVCPGRLFSGQEQAFGWPRPQTLYESAQT